MKYAYIRLVWAECALALFAVPAIGAEYNYREDITDSLTCRSTHEIDWLRWTYLGGAPGWRLYCAGR